MSCDHELASEWARCRGKNASYITILILYIKISKTLFSIIKEGGIVKKVRLVVLGFEIKWDGMACLRPAHTQIFAFFIFFVIIL